MEKSIFFLVSFFIFCACEEVIELDLNAADPKIVIEGAISDVQWQHSVKLTRTVNVDESNEFPGVSGASVKISDDAGNSEVLNETTPGLYSIETLQGIPGRTYTLEVTIDGEIYKAISKMPLLVSIDTVIMENSNREAPLEVSVRFHDPGGMENYYRATQITERGSPPIIVDDDRLQDGSIITLSTSAISDGRYANANLKPGDSLTVSLQSIDKNVYEYLRMLNELQQEGLLGQTALSANPVSNISNGALGYFSAYSQSSKTIIIE